MLTNGQVYTLSETRPWAEAVAIKNGEFVYVGDSAGADTYITEGALTTDLGGRMLIPGIVDAHTHPGQIDLVQYSARFDASGWAVMTTRT